MGLMETIRVTGLWRHLDDGEPVFLVGDLSARTGIRIVENQDKKAATDPDYFLELRRNAYKSQEDAAAEAEEDRLLDLQEL